jgi:preprotein translocase subunit SecE
MAGNAPREDLLMNGTSPMEFLREIRQELAKVTWPTRKETAVTTGMVFVMVFLLALFFLGVDQLISLAVQAILGLGS